MNFKMGILLSLLLSCKPPGATLESTAEDAPLAQSSFHLLDLPSDPLTDSTNGGLDLLVEDEQIHIAGLFRTYNPEMGNMPYQLYYWKKTPTEISAQKILASDDLFYKNNNVSHSDKSRNFLKLMKNQHDEIVFFFLNQYNILQVIEEGETIVTNLGIRCDLIQVDKQQLACLENRGENLILSILDENFQVLYNQSYEKIRHNQTDFIFESDNLNFRLFLKSTIGYANQVNLVAINNESLKYVRYDVNDIGNLMAYQTSDHIHLCLTDKNRRAHLVVLEKQSDLLYRQEINSEFTSLKSCSWNPLRAQVSFFSQTNNQSGANFSQLALTNKQQSSKRRFNEIDMLHYSKVHAEKQYYLGSVQSAKGLRLIWQR